MCFTSVCSILPVPPLLTPLCVRIRVYKMSRPSHQLSSTDLRNKLRRKLYKELFIGDSHLRYYDSNDSFNTHIVFLPGARWSAVNRSLQLRNLAEYNNVYFMAGTNDILNFSSDSDWLSVLQHDINNTIQVIINSQFTGKFILVHIPNCPQISPQKLQKANKLIDQATQCCSHLSCDVMSASMEFLPMDFRPDRVHLYNDVFTKQMNSLHNSVQKLSH